MGDSYADGLERLHRQGMRAQGIPEPIMLTRLTHNGRGMLDIDRIRREKILHTFDNGRAHFESPPREVIKLTGNRKVKDVGAMRP